MTETEGVLGGVLAFRTQLCCSLLSKAPQHCTRGCGAAGQGTSVPCNLYVILNALPHFVLLLLLGCCFFSLVKSLW